MAYSDTDLHRADETPPWAHGEAAVAATPFQFWKLTVRPNNTGHLRCEDGNGHVVYEKALEFTDFPLPEIALYYTDNVILLPSEY